jgi:predicted nucleic acid-binding Zn ribbon protein
MNTKPGAALRALRKRYAIVCAVCGAKHETSDARAKYCSNRCKQAAKYQRKKAEAGVEIALELLDKA